MGDVLFLAHRVPFPPDRGDKIRGFHVLKHLAARRRVHLLAFADDPADRSADAGLAPWTASRAVVWRGKHQAVAAAQALAGGRPVSLTAFASAPMRRAVAAVLAAHPVDTIYVFSSQMAQYVPLRADARVLMDFVDMDSAKFAAYAGNARGPVAWMLAREARLLQGYERSVAARADASLFVSAAEAALFRRETGAERVMAVENGIDTGFFDPAADFARVAAERPLIVFTGQMDYRPNVEGVTWFAERVLPLVPSARFAIVGRNPAPAVRALARDGRVLVTGAVADVRGWLAAADVAVAPLQLARGIQNKVLEAMAMARPVVATPQAAEGIDHNDCLHVAAGPQDFAFGVNELLNNPPRAAALGAAARARAIARYGWDARLAALDALFPPVPA